MSMLSPEVESASVRFVRGFAESMSLMCVLVCIDVFKACNSFENLMYSPSLKILVADCHSNLNTSLFSHCCVFVFS